MNNSFGDVNVLDIIFKPTDILLFAEWNDRKNVQRLNEKYGENLPECVARYLPEIHDKLLRRPYMTCIHLDPDDPRVNRTDDGIVIELDGKKRLFKPLPDGENVVPIPSKDGLVWRKNKLVLPGSGVVVGVDYTVKEFDRKAGGSGFMFDEDLNGCWWMKKGSIPSRSMMIYSAHRSCSPPVTNGRMRFDRYGARPPVCSHNGVIKTNQSLIQ